MKAGAPILAGLTWTEQLQVHTETKLLNALRDQVSRGDTIHITGTKPPCNPGGMGGQSAMADFAREKGVTIVYQQQGAPTPWIFRP